MNVEQELKHVILSQYKSIRAFSIAVNLPYSTIDNIFKRGLMGTGVQTVMKICESLSLDMKELAKGSIVFTNNNMSIKKDFSPLEEEIIEAYRAASPVLQDAVLDILHIKKPVSTEQKKNA